MGPSSRESPFPGAKRYSDQIFLFEYDTDANTRTTGGPSTVILFGWGDGQARHVAKYIAGYRELFPSITRLVVVLATTFKAAYQSLNERLAGMMPTIDAAFPDGPAVDGGSAVLMHAMSSAGGINLVSTLHAYKKRFGGALLPHRLLVLDSTPGGIVFSEQVGRWSRAMAIGMSDRFPWPYAVTYWLCYAFLWLMKGFEWAMRRVHAGASSRAAVNVPGDIVAASPGCRRLYLYSDADEIILAKDIEIHAAEARQMGFDVDLEEFDGSEHCGHLRRHPEQYWRAIADSWREAGAAVK
ncbi:DUF829 domain-containing protein [Microdochium nivale]|nr:DUF829 domain-containing protein [Microdochium nivale]